MVDADHRGPLAPGAWRLRVLGTADAYPHPRPWCGCPQCAEGVVRRRAALLVEGQHTALVDVGGSFYEQMRTLAHRPTLERVVLTHVHSDHFMGMDELLLFDQPGLPIWALDDNWPNIEGAFDYLFVRRNGGVAPLLKRVAPFDPDANWLAADEWCTATPINAYHVGYFTTVGLLFTDKRHGTRVGYFPDLRRLDDDGKARLQGADVLLLDSTQMEGRISSHLSLPEGLALCRELDIGLPVLTHLGHLGLNTAQLRAWLTTAGFPHALIAHDGLLITVDAAGIHIAEHGTTDH
jgi:phosphoribosyl 1,2-cyclic phosphodiesterase